MKVMARVGQLKWNKDGGAGRSLRRRRKKKYKKKKKKKKTTTMDRGSWICMEKGSFVLSCFCFEFKTRNRVFRWEGVGKIGIEGNRERIQIKTMVHLEGKDG